MTYISVVPYNRELIVVNDMDVFTSFFCYAKKQKKGLVVINKPAHAIEEIDGINGSDIENIEAIVEEDLIPVKNLGFRA